jgi:hypothetical protein
MDAASQTIEVQRKLFGFKCELRVTAHQERGVIGRRRADLDFSEVFHLFGYGVRYEL